MDFHRNLSVWLFIHTISQKPMPLHYHWTWHRPTNVLWWILETHLFCDYKVKGQGHESQKQWWHGSLHSCECWRLLVIPYLHFFVFCVRCCDDETRSLSWSWLMSRVHWGCAVPCCRFADAGPSDQPRWSDVSRWCWRRRSSTGRTAGCRRHQHPGRLHQR